MRFLDLDIPLGPSPFRPGTLGAELWPIAIATRLHAEHLKGLAARNSGESAKLEAAAAKAHELDALIEELMEKEVATSRKI